MGSRFYLFIVPLFLHRYREFWAVVNIGFGIFPIYEKGLTRSRDFWPDVNNDLRKLKFSRRTMILKIKKPSELLTRMKIIKKNKIFTKIFQIFIEFLKNFIEMKIMENYHLLSRKTWMNENSTIWDVFPLRRFGIF